MSYLDFISPFYFVLLLIRGWLYFKYKFEIELKFNQYLSRLLKLDLKIIMYFLDLRLLHFNYIKGKMNYIVFNLITILIYLIIILNLFYVF
jgi:hypothetical protein